MTKAEKERVLLEMSRKKYDVIPTTEMRDKVAEIEEILASDLTIWDDIEIYNKYKAINNLNLSDKRLLIVFSVLDGSIARTATYFGVNRRTILNAIERIKNEELKLNDVY